MRALVWGAISIQLLRVIKWNTGDIGGMISWRKLFINHISIIIIYGKADTKQHVIKTKM